MSAITRPVALCSPGPEANKTCGICLVDFDERERLIPGLPFCAASSPVVETLCCSNAERIRYVHETCISNWADSAKQATITQARFYDRDVPQDSEISFSCVNCQRQIKWINAQDLRREIPQSNFERSVNVIRHFYEQNVPHLKVADAYLLAVIKFSIGVSSLAVLGMSTYSVVNESSKMANVARFEFKALSLVHLALFSLHGIGKRREILSFLGNAANYAVSNPAESFIGVAGALNALAYLMQCFIELDNKLHCFSHLSFENERVNRIINNSNCYDISENLSNIRSFQAFLHLLLMVSITTYILNVVRELALKYPKQAQVLVDALHFVGSGAYSASSFMLKNTFKVLGAFSSKTIGLVGAVSKCCIDHVGKMTVVLNSVMVLNIVDKQIQVLRNKFNGLFECKMGTAIQNYRCNIYARTDEQLLKSDINTAITIITIATVMYLMITLLRSLQR